MSSPKPTIRALYDGVEDVMALLAVAQTFGDEKAIAAARKLLQEYGLAVLERSKVDPEGDRAEYVRRYGTS